MSPTVFRYKAYRFFFFSREETRIHIHVSSGKGESKFWIEPEIVLANNHGMPEQEITEVTRVIQEHEQEIRRDWAKHFA